MTDNLVAGLIIGVCLHLTFVIPVAVWTSLPLPIFAAVAMGSAVFFGLMSAMIAVMLEDA